MSSIASLEAELERERSLNRELESELSTIESGVCSANNRLENFNNQICSALDESYSLLNDSYAKMVEALRIESDIEMLYVRFKAMELAHKRIRDCNNKKYYEFANYRRVRKLVQGIMDNLDVNMASDRIIYKSIEKQHLQTPDYWLTCVLLSIMAWGNDDKNLADKAINLSVELDKKNSSLFFMLFNLRMKREDAALKWFRQYQQCELKGSDYRVFIMLFALISKCINSNEEVSGNIRNEIVTFINRIMKLTVEQDDFNYCAIIEKVTDRLNRFVPNEAIEYPALKKYCNDYGKYVSVLLHAKSNISILNFFKEVIYVKPEERNTFIKSFIDECVAKANDNEKDVYEEIEYNEMIIRYEGDVDKAKKVYGTKKIHDEKPINIIQEMINWVYGADKSEVNGQSRLNMLVLTKDYHKNAFINRTNEYRSVDCQHATVRIGEYSTVVDFADKQIEKNKANQYFINVRDDAINKISQKPIYIGIVIAVLSMVAVMYFSYVALIGVLIGCFFSIFKFFSNMSAKKQAEKDYQENCRLAFSVIEQLFVDYSNFQEVYVSYDAYADEIEKELDCV